MIEINPKRFIYDPAPHQLGGVKDLLKHKEFGLFWEMRLRKTATVINTACLLHEAGEIDLVVVVCPAQVKDVWLDKELGEIPTHCFIPARGFSYDNDDFYKKCQTAGLKPGDKAFTFIVTSMEYIRQEDAHKEFPKLAKLKKLINNHGRTWLVVDEGSALGTFDSLQTRATTELRRMKGIDRVTILDGTPEGESPLCLYSKFKIINPTILGFPTFWQFRARHGIIVTKKFETKKGRVCKFKKVTGYKNLDELTRKTAPHVSRLTQHDVGFVEPTRSFFSVQLSGKTWKVYNQMRETLIAQLESGEKMFVNNSNTKILRLAQICSGFLGGFDPILEGDGTVCKEIGRETLDGFMSWLAARLEENSKFKCVAWCRWQSEIERLYEHLTTKYKTRELFLGMNYGGRKDENFLHPNHPWDGAGLMIAQPQAAQYGLNYSKAQTNIWLSGDYRRVTRRQAEARVQAMDSKEAVDIIDVLVTGPNGQRTIVHDILKTQRTKEDVARRLSSDWKRILMEE